MSDTDRGRYTFVRTLSSGGMGRVDLAVRKQGKFTRVLAVKRLLPHHAGDADIQRMFVEEGRIAGLVRHANVVSVQDVGEDDHGPFLVMDYVEGVSLSKLLTTACMRGELLPIQTCVEIVKQIADGLSAAHELVTPTGERGVVHRDVSPSNVLVGFDGVARVTDFGIARALDAATTTQTGIIKGKPGYLAPEQLRFESVDARTDLYSLGVVLYELVAGDRLYRGPASEVYARILREAPPDLGQRRRDIPPELVELWFELASKDPNDRPASAREVSARLGRMLADLRGVEEPIDLAAFVCELCAEDKQEQHILVQSAIAGLDATRNELPLSELETHRLAVEAGTAPHASAFGPTERLSRQRSGRGAWIAAAGALVLALGAAAILVVTLSGENDEVPTEPPATANIAAPAASVEPPVPEAPSVAAVEPAPMLAPAQPEAAPEVIAPEEGTRRGARRGSRASGRQQASRSNAPTWGWQ